jgi:hypothetical protein
MNFRLSKGDEIDRAVYAVAKFQERRPSLLHRALHKKT